MIDTKAFKPGRHTIEVKAKSGKDTVKFGSRQIEFVQRDALKAASDAFLATVLEQTDSSQQVGHQQYFGSTPGAWRQSPSSAMGFSGQARDVFQTCNAVLVVGAGVNNTVDNVWQLDIFDYPNVDVATSGGRFPFRDASFDGVICENVVEHVPDPLLLVTEIERVLRPGAASASTAPTCISRTASPITSSTRPNGVCGCCWRRRPGSRASTSAPTSPPRCAWCLPISRTR